MKKHESADVPIVLFSTLLNILVYMVKNTHLDVTALIITLPLIEKRKNVYHVCLIVFSLPNRATTIKWPVYELP